MELLKLAKQVARFLPAPVYSKLKQSYQGQQLRHQLKRLSKNCFADVPVNLAEVETFRPENFPVSGPTPWLDLPDAEAQVTERLSREELTREQAELCRHWIKNGYVILENVFDSDRLDRIWKQYTDDLAAGKLPKSPDHIPADDPLPGRHLNLFHTMPEIDSLVASRGILDTIDLLFGREAFPFQTMNFTKGSQQGAHTDSVHMTTYPLGYLSAAWIAFEDVHPDSGPLLYYPGSHKLPYVFSKDTGLSAEEFLTRGYDAYLEKYEPATRKIVGEKKLEPQVFHPRKGDVLIWHANLIHGGTARKQMHLTRKSVVCHYFAKNAICYHDLTSRKAEAKPASS